MVNNIGIGWFWSVVNFVVSLGVITCLFALIFKYIPDAKIPWRPALYGAGLSAGLFTIGRILLAWYLGRGSATNVYGAAGSLAAMLIWTYYNGWILFYGAEFTKALARSEGKVPAPADNAVKMTEQDRVQRGVPHTGAIAHAAAQYRPMPIDQPPIRIPVPQIDRRKTAAFSAAGLAAGAVIGGVGVLLLERSRISPELASKRVRDLHDHIDDLEGRVEDARRARTSAGERYLCEDKHAHKSQIPARVVDFVRTLAKKTMHTMNRRAV
jgi:hypothetical protein